MSNKLITVALCAALAGCGGGGGMSGGGASDQPTTPAPASPAAPVVTPPPLSSTKTQGDALLAYIGDDLVVLGCSASYNAPLTDFETDTPNATCSAGNGETSAQTLTRLPAVLAQHPKVIVILTGFNDVREGKTSTASIGEMVEEAEAQGVIVILCTLPPSAGFDPEIIAWNAQIKLLSQTYGTQLADLYAGMEDPDAIPDVIEWSGGIAPAQLMDAAGKYPNANGYGIIWDVICEDTDLDGVESF